MYIYIYFGNQNLQLSKILDKDIKWAYCLKETIFSLRV